MVGLLPQVKSHHPALCSAFLTKGSVDHTAIPRYCWFTPSAKKSPTSYITYVPSHRPRELHGEKHMLFAKKVALREGYATNQVLILAISSAKYSKAHISSPIVKTEYFDGVLCCWAFLSMKIRNSALFSVSGGAVFLL